MKKSNSAGVYEFRESFNRIFTKPYNADENINQNVKRKKNQMRGFMWPQNPNSSPKMKNLQIILRF